MAGDIFSGPTAFQTGDGNTQHNHFHGAGRPVISLPHQVGVIPPRAQSFTGRAEAARLREAASRGGTALPCQVLTGMGGVGKTQLAADEARSAWAEGEVDLLVWVTAVDRASAVAGLGRAGVDMAGADPSDPQAAADAFLAWLEPKTGREPCRWLVVLDDVADPADLRGLWPPDSPTGRTLVTTRRRDSALTGSGRSRIEVGLFTEDEATDYLASALVAGGRTEPDDQLAALAVDLGCLPLALSQAVAYLADQALGIADYRALLADRTRTLTEAVPGSGRLPDDQHTSVGAAWSLSVDLADRQDPPGFARPLLALAAMLDPNGIPASVLTSRPVRELLAAATDRPEPAPQRRRWRRPQTSTAPAPAATEEQVHRALRVLDRLSLVDDNPGVIHRPVRVHSLVQRTARDSLTPGEHTAYALVAADAVLAAWPEMERDADLAQTLRANTAALAARTGPAGCLHLPNVHKVVFLAGRSLGASGQVTAAVTYFRNLADATRTGLGLDHPDTLTARGDLALWQGRGGDAPGAVSALTELLADQERVLGPGHIDTLATRHRLADWRGEAGDAAGAVSAYSELLGIYELALGPDHPGSLETRRAIAFWRGETGDATGAVTAYAELLRDRTRVLGPDHPHTLETRHAIAHWQGEAGDATGAVSAYAELLTDRTRVLGPDHPHTLETRHAIAHWQGEAGDATGAVSAFAELLTDVVRVLGPDHAGTLVTRHNLAYRRGEAGDAAGAVTAYAELLTDRTRVLGPDHPHTLETRRNLTHWRERSGAGPSMPA
ncbi:tetratricopeptide repeat protein [Streptomyces sp. NPDC049040]|uniref:tetratricopeptide repeat protein n=1 Tax=Streptomyces sp. NPDC049040 TaxID=3365593 RepID=UPI00371704F7